MFRKLHEVEVTPRLSLLALPFLLRQPAAATTYMMMPATLSAGSASAQMTGLHPNTAYFFRVRDVAGGQSSPYSAVVGVRTPR